MNLNLEDKVIIVTGGASGIGRSIAQNLALEGAIVCILDNSPETQIDISHSLTSSRGSFFYVLTELTSRDACNDAITGIMQKFNRIDGLVNNAGINDGVGLESGDYLKFIESLDKNVGHYQTMTELTLPELKKTKGVIVNICSKIAETGQGGTSGYAAANGTRVALTKEWATSFLPCGIRVNAVVVAECWTPQYEWWINQLSNPEEKLAEIRSKIPLGNRMTSTDEVAAMVLFLLSEKSSGVNGELMYVDGGYVHLDRAIRPVNVKG
jgi:L-fucose dehydrogenase